MTEQEFWRLIEDNHGEYIALRDALALRSVEEIRAFDDHVWRLGNLSHEADLWCAAYVAMGGCSDDGFDYFRGWLIARGQAVFDAAMRDPDSVHDALAGIEDGGCPQDEDILAVAARAYEAKTKKKDYHDLPRSPPSPRRELHFRWSEDDPGSMRAICPRVFDAFWEKPF
jgi:hypothetical protein